MPERLPLLPRVISTQVMSKRRQLHFDTLDDALQDVESLLQGGYQLVGTWSLGRICENLGSVLNDSREGLPKMRPWPMRIAARMFLRRILSRKSTRIRYPTPIPTAYDGTDEEGVRRFAAGLERFIQPGSSFSKHPWLGYLAPEEWLQLHLWHCEHHLSFLLPQNARDRSGA